MRRFRLGLVLAALAAALVFALARGGDDDEEGGGGEGGGTVSVLSLWGGSEKEAFEKVLAKFTADTGIQTQYETARDFLPVIRLASPRATRPRWRSSRGRASWPISPATAR